MISEARSRSAIPRCGSLLGDGFSEALLFAGCEDVAPIHVLADRWRRRLCFGPAGSVGNAIWRPPLCGLIRWSPAQPPLDVGNATQWSRLTGDRRQADRRLDGAEAGFNTGERAHAGAPPPSRRPANT